ncbi:proteasome subunit beta [Actinomadura opuntiae]|uniref:proteasome subunit beta n=1 Tax=Actinomadura sp. OS1-43 TaxID=604315 RepID=UPI00255B0377|nr:proteasome subunit beta [Actinomadura sp. OS1-43]MDL4820643.1 proteasome subunit beta [Actinomadura sp. OS1-43]
MNGRTDDQGVPPEFFEAGTASFVDLLRRHSPDLLPVNRVPGAGTVPELPHGTTVLALTFPGGVMMAGDRRATQGNRIANRELDKVQRADEYSAVAFAGTVGLALEMVRLFQVELEHYEKMETVPLSLPGKARRLGAVIQANLAQAMQGLAVVPLFAGYDPDSGDARIYTYDITGAPQLARDYHADGSGSPYALGAMKKLYRRDLSLEDAATVCVQALYDAAEDDSATGGPDPTRRIYPTIAAVTADGYRRLPEEQVAAISAEVLEARMQAPDGPVAPLR